MSTALNDPNTSETMTAANGQIAKPFIVKNYAGTELFSVDKDGQIAAPLLVEPHAYNVFKSGANYYAKSGADGSILSSGTDASVVIQAAIDSQKGVYGAVNICNGVYEMTDTISVPYGVGLVAPMPGWYNPNTEQSVGSVLYSELNKPIVQIVEDTDNPGTSWFPYIKNICLWGDNDGAKTAQHGLKVGPVVTMPLLDMHIENVMIGECGGDGIHLEYGGKCWINRGYVENNHGHGIYMSCSSGTIIQGQYNYGNGRTSGANIYLIDTGVSGCLISGNHFRVGGLGDIIFYSNGKTASITGNSFFGATGGTVPAITVQTNNKDKYVSITGNNFYDYPAAVSITKGAYWTTNVPYVSISGNMFQGCDVPILSSDFSLSASNFLIGRNIGYVSVNSGTSTGTGSEQTIAHGLALTPSKVLLSEGTTGGAFAYQSKAADATNIYITATNEKTYAWRAEI